MAYQRTVYYEARMLPDGLWAHFKGREAELLHALRGNPDGLTMKEAWLREHCGSRISNYVLRIRKKLGSQAIITKDEALPDGVKIARYCLATEVELRVSRKGVLK